MKSLSVLANEFGYNYSYLSNIFKITTNSTVFEYYQNCRLGAAKLLINEGKLKFIEIAELLNYSSLYSFSKAFKQKYGVSPRNYKHEI